MQILKLEPYLKTKCKVFTEDFDRPSFILYNHEVRKYDLKEGGELSDGLYSEILEEVLIKRARQRALYLLDDYSRTESQLRRKLAEGFYPGEAIDAAIEYAKSRHYLDDEYYAQEFAAVRTQKKSRRMVEKEMMARGIDREIIESTMNNLETDEKDTICALIGKKYPDVSRIDIDQKNKLLRSLMAKGFDYDDCRKAFESMLQKENI